jgi:polyhydroxyalkanoate synthesis regulator phasin
MRLDDVRKTVEATLGNLTPAKAQELSKSFLEPGAAKDQVARTTADILEWSHKNRERLRESIRREIRDQMKQMGVATQGDVDALKKRVRDLERRAGMTASGRSKTTARKPAARQPAASKPIASKPIASKPIASKPVASKPVATKSSTSGADA